jgi:hypothetical protein
MGGFAASNFFANPIFHPEFSYKIDLKIDDGYPSTGSIRSQWPGGAGSNSCVLNTTTPYTYYTTVASGYYPCNTWFGIEY